MTYIGGSRIGQIKKKAQRTSGRRTFHGKAPETAGSDVQTAKLCNEEEVLIDYHPWRNT
jgi:hypothetical protein